MNDSLGALLLSAGAWPNTRHCGDELIAIVLFCLMKFIGYWLFATWLTRRYPEVEMRPILFGALRALVGIASGITLAVFLYSGAGPRAEGLEFYILLACLRTVEWAMVLWLCFARHVEQDILRRISLHTAIGTCVSLALDAVAVVVGRVLARSW